MSSHPGQHIFIFFLFMGAVLYLFLILRRQFILRKNAACGNEGDCKCNASDKWDKIAREAELKEKESK